MRVSHIPFERIAELNYKDVFYQTKTEELADYIKYLPDLDGLKQAISDRKSFNTDRALLTSVLKEQYSGIAKHQYAEKQLAALENDNTFTIITAHQPCLFGGPAYYFYKICSAIHLAEVLKKEVPECHFVPVFVNGAEDHDFDEVRKVSLFGKDLFWETNQTGPVGRFSTEGIAQTLEALAAIMGSSERAKNFTVSFQRALDASNSYNEFVFHWLHEIFGNYGLVIVNMDHKRMKEKFVPLMKRELLHRESEMLVKQTQNNLESLHFKPQAFARDINLFYMHEGVRERIIFENGSYKIQNTSQIYTEDEILEHLESHTERFSPNVVLRPLYQEVVLPNIAYIGGGGEIAYWLERKKQFEHFNVFFPVLIRRNSVMFITQSIQKNMEKLQVTESDLLLNEEKLITSYLEKHAPADFHIEQEISALRNVFKNLAVRAKTIDATLEGFVLSEGHKSEKSLESIETRLKRALKHKEETSINQLRNIKTKLFPGNGLQERVESFLQYAVTDEMDMLEYMIHNLNPLDKRFLFVYL